MTENDQPDPEQLSADEYRLLTAQFRTDTFGTLPDVIGVDHLDNLNILLGLTINAFRHAKELHDGGEAREAVKHALRASWMFFAGFRTMLGENLCAPLQDALDGIRALDNGLVVPLLGPAKKSSGGRAEDTAYRRGFVDLVVFTVNMLEWHGFTAKEARTLVAKRLQQLGIEPSRVSTPRTDRTEGEVNRITEGTIKYWCGRVRANKEEDLLAAFVMNSTTRDALAPKNKPSTAERERICRRVLEEMLPFFAQLPGVRPKKDT